MSTIGQVSAQQPNADGNGPPGMLTKLFQLATSRYAVSLAAQIMMSGFHTILSFLLIRMVAPYDFGVYAFAFVLAMFASATNNALISTPLTVYTPVVKDERERAQQEDMFSTLNLLLFVVLILAGVAYSQWSNMGMSTTLAVTLFVAFYSARQFSRSFGYARFKPLVTASGDIVYVTAGVLFIAISVFASTDGLDIRWVLCSLAAANLTAMLVERWRIHGASRKGLLLAKIQNYGQVWLQSRWALVGALTTLFMSQAHSLVITSLNGPEAFAPLAAGMVMFGPVRVALLTWQNMVKPELALALSNNEGEAVKKQIRTTTFLMGAAVLAMGAVIWLLWPYIFNLLYAEKYGNQPMGYIVLLWSLITLFAAIYNAPSAALQAMKDFHVLAMASVYGAIISGVLVMLILYFVNAESTLLGILAAECFMAVYLIRVMLNHLKKDWQ